MSTKTVTRPARAARRPVAWGDWTRLVVASLSRVVVLTIVGGLFWAVAPSLVGLRPTTVMSDSMAPRFLTGDVAVSAPATPELETIGSILLVDDPDHPGRLRLHRMHDVTPEGEIVTKGDANAQPDSSHITQDHVRGVAVLRIPFVGMPLVWARYGQWPLVALAGAGFLALVVLSCLDADLRRRGGVPQAPTRRALRRQRRRDRVVPPILLVGSASTVALLLAVTTTDSHAAFASSTPNPPSAWTAAADFACWPTARPSNTPYFYYRFNSTASPTPDASANNRPANLGSGTFAEPGVCPGAGASPSRTFDGSPSAVIAPSMAAITAPNTFSLAAWFKTSTSGRIMGFSTSQSGDSTGYDRHLYIDTAGKLVFGVWPGAFKMLTSPNVVSDGAWHHVVATMSSTAGMRLYVDGVLVGSDTATRAGQDLVGYWRVGYDNLYTWPNAGSYSFTGQLDNVAVFTTALSTSQVSAQYTTGH